MRSGGQPTLSGTRRPKQENDSIPRVAPKWLKHDRQVSFLSWAPSFTARWFASLTHDDAARWRAVK